MMTGEIDESCVQVIFDAVAASFIMGAPISISALPGSGRDIAAQTAMVTFAIQPFAIRLADQI
jgi:hypothetical protein